LTSLGAALASLARIVASFSKHWSACTSQSGCKGGGSMQIGETQCSTEVIVMMMLVLLGMMIVILVIMSMVMVMVEIMMIIFISNMIMLMLTSFVGCVVSACG
jgi:sensor histidine kinase YesM